MSIWNETLGLFYVNIFSTRKQFSFKNVEFRQQRIIPFCEQVKQKKSSNFIMNVVINSDKLQWVASEIMWRNQEVGREEVIVRNWLSRQTHRRQQQQKQAKNERKMILKQSKWKMCKNVDILLFYWSITTTMA